MAIALVGVFLLLCRIELLVAAEIKAINISEDRKELIVADNDGGVSAYELKSGQERWRVKLPSLEILDLGIFPQRSKNWVIAVTKEEHGPGLRRILWGEEVLASRLFYGVTRARKLPETTASSFLDHNNRLALAESWGPDIYLLDVLSFTEKHSARMLSVSDFIHTQWDIGDYGISQLNTNRHPSSLAMYDRDELGLDDPFVSISGCGSASSLVGVTKKGYLYGWKSPQPTDRESRLLPRWKPTFVRDLKMVVGGTQRHGVSCSRSGTIVTTVNSRRYGSIQVFDEEGMLVSFTNAKDRVKDIVNLRRVEWGYDGEYIMACEARHYVLFKIEENSIRQIIILQKKRKTACGQRMINGVSSGKFLLASGQGIWEYDCGEEKLRKVMGKPMPLRKMRQ